MLNLFIPVAKKSIKQGYPNSRNAKTDDKSDYKIYEIITAKHSRIISDNQ